MGTRDSMPNNDRNTHEVVAALRERIASQELLPGTKVREAELVEEFGFSRTVIRDAFTELSSKGFLRRIPNRGAYVAQYDYEDMINLYDVREVLESKAYQLAARNAPEGAWDDLISAFSEPMEKSVSDGNIDALVDAIETMDRRVAELAQNPFLEQTLEPIADLTQIFLRRMMLLPGRAEKGLELSRQLLTAMASRDERAVDDVYRQMMDVSRSYLTKYWRLFFG